MRLSASPRGHCPLIVLLCDLRLIVLLCDLRKVFFRDHDGSRFAALCTTIRWGVYTYVLIGGGLIVGTRLHYTLDVLVAMLLTYSVFTWYHSWLR